MFKQVKYVFVLILFIRGVLNAQYFMNDKNQIGAYFLPEFSFDIVKTANRYQNYQPRGFSYSAGILYKRMIKEKLWLRGGLFYSQLTDVYSEDNPLGFVDQVSFTVHRIGIPAYVGYYFNPYDFVFTVGIGGGVNLLFNLNAYESHQNINGYGFYTFTNDQMEDMGFEVNLHWIFQFKPYRHFIMALEPHFNFNAVPIVNTVAPSNYLRLGGMFSVSYTFN